MLPEQKHREDAYFGQIASDLHGCCDDFRATSVFCPQFFLKWTFIPKCWIVLLWPLEASINNPVLAWYSWWWYCPKKKNILFYIKGIKDFLKLIFFFRRSFKQLFVFSSCTSCVVCPLTSLIAIILCKPLRWFCWSKHPTSSGFWNFPTIWCSFLNSTRFKFHNIYIKYQIKLDYCLLF